jgi:WXG100 family type VII secretion target
MTVIKVTPAELTALSGGVAQGSAQIDSVLTGLARQLTPLAGGTWAGQASTQFTQLWEQWHVGAAQLNESLQGISRLLAQASDAYATAETQIASSFRT